MATLAEILRQAGYVTPQGVAGPNAPLAKQLKNYVTNVIPTAAQNISQQRADIDASLTMGDQGIQIGDREAFERQMAQVPNLMGATAYHGTPHTIKGKFDINKVGTGEGSQAFGHGMYFAENPKVAIGYRDALAVDPNVASEKLQFKTLETFMPTEKKAVQGEIQAFIDGTGNYNDFVRVINQEGSDAFKKALLKEEPNLFSAGNLYKVDIPDADIPNMLDWDKPLKDQAKILENILSKNSGFTGQTKREIQKLANKGVNAEELVRLFGKDQKELSEELSKLGITGIRYLDEGSRNAGKGTSNFVVFDPSQVKILEQNSKPVTRKEILEQQINKIE